MADRAQQIQAELQRRQRIQAIQAELQRRQSNPLPDGDAAMRKVAAEMDGPSARLAAMGSVMNDLGENIESGSMSVLEKFGITGPNDRARMERRHMADDQGFKALEEEQPTNTLVGRGLAQAGLFAAIPASQGSLPARMAAGSLEGGLTGAVTASETEDPWRNFVIGSSLGAIAPALVTSVGKVVNRLSTKPIQVIVDGKFTDEAMETLRKSDLTPEDFAQDVAKGMRESGVTKETLERFNLFEEMGLKPTRAQVTGLKDDWLVQQEMLKQSGGVAERMAEQDAIIGQHIDALITRTGGKTADSIDASNVLQKVVSGRVNQVDEAIDAAYQAARQQANKAKVVSFPRLERTLRRLAPQNRASNGLVEAVAGDMQNRGLMDKAMKTAGRKGTVEASEEVRKTINALSSADPQNRARIAKELKAALDADVQAAVGEDVFSQARKTKAQFERSIERARATRRDVSRETLLEKVAQNKINNDQLITKIGSKATEAGEVDHLVRFLKSGDPQQVQEGMEALAEIKSATLREFYAKATSSQIHEGGVPVFSGKNFKKALDAFGNQKLSVLFDEQELTMLGQIARVGELKIPPEFTALGGGPSGRAVLGSIGADVESLTSLSDPATNVLLRLTKGVFSQARRARLEQKILHPEKTLQRAIPNRVPLDRM